MKRRVVVTGVGTVNPAGNDIPSFWKSLKEGKTGIGPITHFDTEGFAAKVAGEVKDFDPSQYIDRKEARKMARFTVFAVASAVQAAEDAGLKEGNFDPYRTGVCLGNGIGGFEVIEENMMQLFKRGPSGIAPMTIPKMICNEGPANVSIKLGLHGPSTVVATACASATDAVGQSLDLIRSGRVDCMFTGGMEAAITSFSIGGFSKIQALSTKYNETPEKACRPFDKDRDGFIMGEGAGVLILEELEHAKKRNAPIYAELVGYGSTCDAGHLTAPDPDGIGAAASMTLALDDAGLKPEDIDYINAHGTSTPTNDPIETKAIKLAFGDHAYKLKVSSSKGVTAHMVGGAGGVEAIVSVLAIKNGFIPGTLNLENPDEGCDLDYVPGAGIDAEVNTVLSDSLGFGGHNASIIFKKYKD
ncbi:MULTISPECIES: beta-ketoacyl-ACP synthase II [unclassified Oceanispirochaeta]|uniref:beta-ketoacyl-ACP synthase II n=1 Tax=unclassified Oceanispirochaeta TaxID=2635722 RepID=UPI000E097EF9|nr:MULTISPECIES: beta-ketoacyl-ACP synthase II [unclassified Oceanispirochaeta]MBF9017810.1 beta-ketoacyl-ACP synthase II [Oceanispirochaeta sp. M2]NPD74270.1 beta-ketoacyl-ACP synthase II [Oceanispirochaeta sp. M1]RDG29860.1 beta-ketoacyl-[acyl-carrier-protein] synthase II [Oceanispirochaeta sp. M1]